MINSDTNNNNTDRNNNNNNTLNNFIASSSLFQKPKAAVVQPEEEDEELENTSVCSSVSSLTDDEGNAAATGEAAAIASNRQQQQQKRKKKSKFTVTPRNNTAANTTSRASDAVSISFLRQQQEPAITQPTQIIQKALTGLRPGGVFFVLDYRDETAGTAPIASTMAETNNKTSLESPGTEEDHARSPQSCSIAMKEIPEDLVQQWNLTMVPTNLENYYNTKLKQPTAKPAPARVSLPASRRIVRWMGIKPRQQVSPHS